MYIRTNKTKNKIFLGIVILIIALTTITLCLQTISKPKKTDIIEKTIIAGNEISKNKATEVLDIIDWMEDTNPLIGALTIGDNGKSIQMTGNWLYQGKNTIYYIPDSRQKQTQTFS